MRPEMGARGLDQPGADAPWGPRRLASIEAEFFALRRRPADLPAAFAAAVAVATGCDGEGDAAVGSACEAGARLADAVSRAPNNLAYHNPHHFAETVLVMGWLCGMARRAGRLGAAQAGLGVVAMVGHDFLHDGSPASGGRLEAIAAAATLRALCGVDLTDEARETVRAVILGTNPDLVRSNAARAAGLAPEGPLGEAVDLLCALGNEADVFASFLPDMGPRQSELLAMEWQAGGHAQAADVLGYANRLAFLRLYDRLTPMARQMGIATLRARQFAAFACGAGLLEVGGTPDEGAAALDALPPRDARRRFTSCLREMPFRP
jgi:hypothetical protein